ncbi:MAG TPA: XdhC/CoxI family protein [bacterium]|nr:XdhC/CoxI family protein [bacterium]
MKELRDILDALAEAQARGERTALGTVIRVRGSTYRREGARLLIRADGRTVGSVSGGCLEGDIAEIARGVLDSGQARLAQYDLTSDDDAVWGLGLGCNGAIDVFIEPVAGDLPARLRRAIDERRTLVLATLIAGPEGLTPGARLYLPEDGAAEGTLGDPALDAAARAASRTQLDAHKSAVVSLAGSRGPAEVFVEVLVPPLPLLICGAGHDTLPVAHLAHELGWWVMVADSRPAFATRDRFPGADEVVLADDADVPKKVRIDRNTFVVVMTHNFLHDRTLLRALLGTPARYIGLLGPRARTDRLLADLARDGVPVDDGQRARLFAPVGVDLGAESPEEIALSILAEILALHNGRRVASLRERGGPIHARA